MGFFAVLSLILATAKLTPALRRQSNHLMRSDDLRPLNDTTALGCKCKSEASCAPSLAQHHRCDWCYVPKGCGDYTLSRGSYDFCEYKPPDSFTSLSADAKLKQLWKKITGDKRVQPMFSKGKFLLVLLKLSMISTFDNSMEVFNKGRQKVIHQQGVVLQFDLEVENSSPYTGMLRPGKHRGLLRLGSAFPPETDIFPGVAVKFLRSGIHSANTVLLRQTGAKTGQNQFFEEALTNHVAPSKTLTMLKKFIQASGCRSMTGLSDFCTYAQDGKRARSANFPYEIKFDAPNRAQFPINTRANDITAEVMRALKTIPAGTHLYNFYAKSSPSARWDRIGKIVTKSAATTSWFGDTQLFFRHQRMEEDFKKHPEWIKAARVDKPFCDASTDSKGRLRPVSDWQCPGVDGVPPV